MKVKTSVHFFLPCMHTPEKAFKTLNRLLFLILVLLFSCQSGFRQHKYAGRKWVAADPVTVFQPPVSDSSSMFFAVYKAVNVTDEHEQNSQDTIVTQNNIPDASAVEKNNLPVAIPSAAKSKTFRPITEKSIRTKGFLSISSGVAAGSSLVYGLIIIVSGIAWGFLLLLAALLFAYAGIHLSLGSKRDIDTLSDRSTKAWLNRPATLGFIINVSVLILLGLFLLISIPALL